jgi:hypothetical protein
MGLGPQDAAQLLGEQLHDRGRARPARAHQPWLVTTRQPPQRNGAGISSPAARDQHSPQRPAAKGRRRPSRWRQSPACLSGPTPGNYPSGDSAPGATDGLALWPLSSKPRRADSPSCDAESSTVRRTDHMPRSASGGGRFTRHLQYASRSRRSTTAVCCACSSRAYLPGLYVPRTVMLKTSLPGRVFPCCVRLCSRGCAT